MRNACDVTNKTFEQNIHAALLNTVSSKSTVNMTKNSLFFFFSHFKPDMSNPECGLVRTADIIH